MTPRVATVKMASVVVAGLAGPLPGLLLDDRLPSDGQVHKIHRRVCSSRCHSSDGRYRLHKACQRVTVTSTNQHVVPWSTTSRALSCEIWTTVERLTIRFDRYRHGERLTLWRIGSQRGQRPRPSYESQARPAPKMTRGAFQSQHDSVLRLVQESVVELVQKLVLRLVLVPKWVL